MTITNDYQVFLNGCIKNNAVDYKVLYENQCKQLHCDDDGYADSEWFNEKMDKHIECHLGGDGEWGSLGFKTLQEFVDAYDKLEEEADAENTANMINKLNEEYQKLQEEFEDYKKKSEILDKYNNERAESFYDLSQTLIMTLINQGQSIDEENIYIGDQFDYRFTTDIRNAFEEAMDDMNKCDWNGDGRQCQMVLIDNELCIDIRDPDDMTDEDSSDEE